MGRILIVRNFVENINENYYNIQEIGIGIALAKSGYDVDILLHGDENKDIVYYKYNDKSINLVYRNSLSFLNSPIYLEFLKKAKNYDLIISSEVGKIYNFLLTFFKFNKWIIYHGPYRDNRKFVQLLVDLVFKKRIDKKVNYIFTKSEIAKNYLLNKGFSKVKSVGVALNEKNFIFDTSNISSEFSNISSDPSNISKDKRNFENFVDEKLLEMKKTHKLILYIGRFDKDKNVTFIPDIFKYLDNSYKLVFIGGKKDNNQYKEIFFEKVKQYNLDIYYIEEMEQKKLGFYYKNSDIFILPSSYEIFGMVLLEAMYFGCPVISSYNGGSSFLINQFTNSNQNSKKQNIEDKKEQNHINSDINIENNSNSDNINGIIIKEFDPKIWAERIKELATDKSLRQKIINNANKTIENYKNWDKIVKEFLDIL